MTATSAGGNTATGTGIATNGVIVTVGTGGVGDGRTSGGLAAVGAAVVVGLVGRI